MEIRVSKTYAIDSGNLAGLKGISEIGWRLTSL